MQNGYLDEEIKLVELKLNELIRHLRHDRNVSLTETRGNWSAATMSRYEHGEIDLADDVVTQMATPLGLDYEDLIDRHIISEDDLNDWRFLASETWSREHAERLRARLNSLKVKGTRNDFLKVATDVMTELLRIHKRGIQNMDGRVITELDAYLASLDDFSRIEGILFSVCTEYVPVATGWKWVSRQAEMVINGVTAPQVIRRIISFSSGVAERAAIEQNFELMREIMNHMWKLDAMIPENAFQRYNLQSLEALYADQTVGSTATHARLIHVMNTGKAIFTAASHKSIIRFTIQQGWATPGDFGLMA
jgi:hypothetical protein